MTLNQPIRTTGNRRRRFEVVVQPSFLHDVLLSMWSALGANDKAGTHELGKRWFSDLRRSIPADVVEQLTEFGGDSGKTWLGLIDLVAHAPDPEDTAATLEWLETAEWEDRRRDLVAEWCWEADAVDVPLDAVRGELRAREYGHGPEGTPPTAVRQRLCAVRPL